MAKYEDDFTPAIIGAAIEVHRALGPALLESAYRTCLAHELRTRGLEVQEEKPLSLAYKGVNLECSYRADLIVQDTVLVELKAQEALHPIHESQLLTYLKLTGLKVCLLINFNVPLLRDGIRRIVR